MLRAKIQLAILWHQHQPMYAHPTVESRPDRSGQPWVRLHAIRDYYSMAALLVGHPDVHLTINLTPVLLRQIEDYVEGATDVALDLTCRPAEDLPPKERERILATFFDADWHHQIFPHRRYKELFDRRRDGVDFTPQELRDLQMWFNLAWFGKEFRDADVQLVTGETVTLGRFVEQGEGFTVEQIETMIDEQRKILRAVIPVHRALQDRGQVEISTTPFYHPILPLLIDSDQSTIDRPGATLPKRFAYPQDADAQVKRAVDFYTARFGRPPRGMWPAEGAVSQSVVPIFARHGVEWIATDQDVLSHSGRWGYEAYRGDVLCRPYRAEAGGHAISVFFRDPELSDAVGFHYHGYSDYHAAARHFVETMKRHCVHSGDRIHTIILDGENAWGAYREDARPFLHALYGLLEGDPDIVTVTFGEYLSGNAARGMRPHSLYEQEKVYDLYSGSWIDEMGSAPGPDHGTWIGEEEENSAWELLLRAREALDASGATSESAPQAFESLYAAEGSDWFWWYGADQDSGRDWEFDDLFRAHLRNVYRSLGRPAPPELFRPVVPRVSVWTFSDPIANVWKGDRLSIQTHCPGDLSWHWDAEPATTAPLEPAGGVMAGTGRYHKTLEVPPGAVRLQFTFRCTHRDCDGRDTCCREADHVVQVR